VVYGEFECSFTGLQDAYNANGLFMATGLKDLFIAKHLARIFSLLKHSSSVEVGNGRVPWLGPRTGYCSPVRSSKSCSCREAFRCGVTRSRPSLRLFLSRRQCSTTYRGDPNYGYFAWAVSQGLSDGFCGAMKKRGNPTTGGSARTRRHAIGATVEAKSAFPSNTIRVQTP
jgi:hypothetical protein